MNASLLKTLNPELENDPELKDLKEMVSEFALLMVDKLTYKYKEEGNIGWDEEPVDFFAEQIELHMEKGIRGQEVDIANFCAMHLRSREKEYE